MAEQTQTEKLRVAIVTILMNDMPAYEQSQLILKVSKEAGLKFIRVGVKGDDLRGAYICKVEEIEI